MLQNSQAGVGFRPWERVGFRGALCTVFLLKFGVGGSQELRRGWSQLALLCALSMAGR